MITAEEIRRKRDDLFAALSRESDRGLVLVSAAFLDQALKLLLVARFEMRHVKPKKIMKTLFDGYGPLHTFAAKIGVAYSIDLIEEWMYRDFETIRKLRNAFAHGIEAVQFDATEVVELTKRLEGADRLTAEMRRAAESKEQKQSSGIDSSGTAPEPDDRRKIASLIDAIKVSQVDGDEHPPLPQNERERLCMTVVAISAQLYAYIGVLNSDVSVESKERLAMKIGAGFGNDTETP